MSVGFLCDRVFPRTTEVIADLEGVVVILLYPLIHLHMHLEMAVAGTVQLIIESSVGLAAFAQFLMKFGFDIFPDVEVALLDMISRLTTLLKMIEILFPEERLPESTATERHKTFDYALYLYR